MNTKDRISLLFSGFLIWAIATLGYRWRGTYFFEASTVGYWLNVIVSGILCSIALVAFMKWRQIEQQNWLTGAVCLALPGMLCEIPILAGFSEIMNNLQPATAGRYAAYLFCCYSSIIGCGWLLSISDQQSLHKHDAVK